VSVRQDFINAYTAMWSCSAEYADGLLRHIELEFAEEQNKRLIRKVDELAGAQAHEESQERRRLRDEVNKWKDWEARARGATMQIVELTGHGGTSLTGRLQMGLYDEALDQLRLAVEAGRN
jgi:hypothetical protein